MGYKGFYKVKNPKKYRGDPTQCIFRSLWERKFMKFCDYSEKVLSWSSEEIRIPYRSPLDKRIHTYFVDFWVELLDKNGKTQNYLIEIKPKKQVSQPIFKKSKASHIGEMKRFVINTEKWKSAKEFCRTKGWKFLILTEEHLFGKNGHGNNKNNRKNKKNGSL